MSFGLSEQVFVTGSEQGWANGSEDHFVARALYTFQGEGNNELSFQAGSNINIAPKGLFKNITYFYCLIVIEVSFEQ